MHKLLIHIIGHRLSVNILIKLLKFFDYILFYPKYFTNDAFISIIKK